MGKFDEEDKRSRWIGMIVSILVHLAILIGAIYIIAWSPPDPPIPEYGIEVNFGFSDEGFGTQQDISPVEVDEPEPEIVQETVEEVVEEMESEEFEEEVVEETAPEQIDEPADVPVEEVETVAETEVEQEVEASPVEEEKEEKKTPKKETKKEESKEINKEKQQEVKEKTDPQEDKKEEKKVPQSDGNKKDTKGNMGSTIGDKLASNLDGAGGSGGSSLDMLGWRWVEKPQVNDATNETGELRFEIAVSASGRVIYTKLIYRNGITPTTSKLYKNALEETVFEPDDLSRDISGITKGTVVFHISER